jgi:hypothetical protein
MIGVFHGNYYGVIKFLFEPILKLSKFKWVMFPIIIPNEFKILMSWIHDLALHYDL